MTRADLDARFKAILSELDGIPEPMRVTGYDPATVSRTLQATVKAIALIKPLGKQDDVFVQQLGKQIEVSPSHASPQCCKAIIEGARDHFVGGFDKFREAVLAEAFDDLLSMADYLHRSGFQLAAVAIAGAVLEDALRKVHVSRIGRLPKDDMNLNSLNQALWDAEVYGQPYWREVKAWADLRNGADHGKYSNSAKHKVLDETGQPYPEVDPRAVRRMLDGVRDFVAKYLA